MDLSIAAGLDGSPLAGSRSTHPAQDGPAGGRDLVAAGLAIVLVMLVLYGASNLNRASPYDHFVRQADAFLDGRAAITLPQAGYFQDAMPLLDAAGNPTAEALIPFPPLPAIVLLPFVAVFGLATNGQWIATLIAALAVGLALAMLDRLPVTRRAKLLATVFLGAGTVLWYAAAIGTTWFLAHVIAVAVALLAVAAALDAERRPAGAPPRGLADLLVPDRRALTAGLLLGLAATARLPMVLATPFVLVVGSGAGSVPLGRLRHAAWAGLGVAIPVLGLLAYNLATTGHLFHPAYEYQYQREAYGYPTLGYNPAWAIEDIRYIPQNVALMLGQPPIVLPPCAPGLERSLLSTECPWLLPDPKGMSLLLTSPGWLLALAGLRSRGLGRIVGGAGIAVLAITILNLAHFSQGWVQFGYRFSNDIAPFALPLVALGIDRLGPRGWWLAVTLVAISIVVNLWGVLMGVRLGW